MSPSTLDKHVRGISDICGNNAPFPSLAPESSAEQIRRMVAKSEGRFVTMTVNLGLFLVLTGCLASVASWYWRSEWEASSHALCADCQCPHEEAEICPLVLGEE